MSVVIAVGRMFFEILKEVSKEYPPEAVGIRGKLVITLYNEELENQNGRKMILKGDGVSVIVSEDCNLELSNLFGNCWIKPLPRAGIVKEMEGNKGYLQTVGIICDKDEAGILVEEFCKAGVTRITRGATMSDTLPGEAHDGGYPLRRYSKIVECEI